MRRETAGAAAVQRLSCWKLLLTLKDSRSRVHSSGGAGPGRAKPSRARPGRASSLSPPSLHYGTPHFAPHLYHRTAAGLAAGCMTYEVQHNKEGKRIQTGKRVHLIMKTRVRHQQPASAHSSATQTQTHQPSGAVWFLISL